MVLPLQNRLYKTRGVHHSGIRANAVLYIFAAFVFLAAVAESIWIGLPFEHQDGDGGLRPPCSSLLCGIIFVADRRGSSLRLYWTGYPGSALGGTG